MAQAFICDTCNKHEEPKDSLSLPPAGWYMVYQRTKPTQHFCDEQCLETFAREQRIAKVVQADLKVSA